jgi:uncharacterized protein
MAKSPVPGAVKTRLCPPFDLGQAARVAEAALADTLAAAVRADAPAPMLALDGPPGPWLPSDFRVVPQRGGGLDERIAAVLADADEPVLVIGMDTPQVTPQLLESAIDLLESPGLDAVMGPAVDGGWWALGLRRPGPEAVLGVPMSTPFTGAAQQERLRLLGLRCAVLPTLRDVDRIDDALAVAAEVPGSLFAGAVDACLTEGVGGARGRPVLAGAR